MPLPLSISANWLRNKRACGASVLLFKSAFNITDDYQEVPITHENLLIAARNNIYVGWLGKALFGRMGSDIVYYRTLADYQEYCLASSFTPEEDAALVNLYIAQANVIWDLYQEAMKEVDNASS